MVDLAERHLCDGPRDRDGGELRHGRWRGRVRDVFWIGRFADRWETGPRLVSDIPARRPAMLVYRRDVKLHLCGQARAKDANVRQALIDGTVRVRRGRLV